MLRGIQIPRQPKTTTGSDYQMDRKQGNKKSNPSGLLFFFPVEVFWSRRKCVKKATRESTRRDGGSARSAAEKRGGVVRRMSRSDDDERSPPILCAVTDIDRLAPALGGFDSGKRLNAREQASRKRKGPGR